jgi:hypothetical protein
LRNLPRPGAPSAGALLTILLDGASSPAIGALHVYALRLAWRAFHRHVFELLSLQGTAKRVYQIIQRLDRPAGEAFTVGFDSEGS